MQWAGTDLQLPRHDTRLVHYVLTRKSIYICEACTLARHTDHCTAEAEIVANCVCSLLILFASAESASTGCAVRTISSNHCDFLR